MTPPAAAPGHPADLAQVAGAFGHLLHDAGVPVTPERAGRFSAAVALAAPAGVEQLYWLGRVTLLSGVEQVPVYDAVFGQVFRGWADVADSRGDTAQVQPSPRQDHAAPLPRPRAGAAAPSGAGLPAPGASGAEDEVSEALQVTSSAAERLHSKDFGTLDPEELADLRALLAALPLVLPVRSSRRRVRRRAGDEVDVRATLRRARRTGADPVDRVHRRRRTRSRRLVLIADVSGSMEPYARAYLHLLHAAVRATRAEAFVFSTRLTRLTRALATRDPDLALSRAAATAPDWSGGTRIGLALKEFNDRYGRRGMARGAVVVIVSDGWEHGDPTLLAQELERLSRLAHRIVWVNPRKASPRYEPLAGGMAAALPWVDRFVSGHSLAALDEVLAAVRGDG